MTTIKDNNVNSQIKAPRVQLISAEGNNLGTVEALKKAQYEGLDLVQIAFKEMPVCQIMDYSKHKYEQKKKLSEQKKKQQKNVVKEIRLTPRIEQHDIDIKIRRAKEFLEDNCNVRVSMSFKGRENNYKEHGKKIMEQFIIPGYNHTGIKTDGNIMSVTLGKV
jgi:translation initiation factor IF-3